MVKVNAKAPGMKRALLALASALLIAVPTVSAHSTSTSFANGNEGRVVITSDENEYNDIAGFHTSEIVAEFLDWDANSRSSASLQNGKTGDSTSESSYCNTWCMLKQSLGLTIVGLLLICIRLVPGKLLVTRFVFHICYLTLSISM
jgi:hypothetical protein